MTEHNRDPRLVVDPTVDEYGAEHHPSWLMIRAGRPHATPGQPMFDSDIRHSEYVTITIEGARRTREIKRDRIMGDSTTLMEIRMSMAQWGAFVSSFGSSGVPATLSYTKDGGYTPRFPDESRLAETLKDVASATAEGIEEVREAFDKVMSALEASSGKKEMRSLMNTLSHRIGNLPANMKYAAATLTEHTENVVTKARFDIEAMVARHAEHLGLDAAVTVERLGLSAAQTPELSPVPPIDKQAWLTSVVKKMNETGGAFEDSVAQGFLANTNACVIANKNHTHGWLWVKLPEFLTQEDFEEVDPSDEHYVGHDGQREHDHPDVQFEDTRCSMCMHAIGPVLDEDDDGPRERWITCFAYNSNGHGGWVEEDFLLCEDCLADLPEGPSER